MVWSWLEPHGQGEEEAAAGRIRCHVEVVPDRGITEVRDLGIEPGIVAPRLHVAGTQTQPYVPNAQAERIRNLLRYHPAERDLAQLHERGVLDERRHHAVIVRVQLLGIRCLPEVG